MDEVDYGYKDEIIGALNFGDVNRLRILVSSLSVDEAKAYINRWNEIRSEVRELNKVGNSSEKVNALNTELCSIPYELLDKADLSHYFRNRH